VSDLPLPEMGLWTDAQIYLIRMGEEHRTDNHSRDLSSGWLRK
jgi:hypothetical protein